MITSDYKIAPIDPIEYQDLKEIAGVAISSISLDDYSNLLVFPDSFEEYDRNFGKKVVCEIVEEKNLITNSIVGFMAQGEFSVDCPRTTNQIS